MTTQKPLFTYAGHAMGVKYIEQFDGRYYIETVSLSQKPIDDGYYPRHFAEGEAVDAITNLTVDDKYLDETSLHSTQSAVKRAISELLAAGVFTN